MVVSLRGCVVCSVTQIETSVSNTDTGDVMSKADGMSSRDAHLVVVVVVDTPFDVTSLSSSSSSSCVMSATPSSADMMTTPLRGERPRVRGGGQSVVSVWLKWSLLNKMTLTLCAMM
jgi:hypothetical protein